MNVKSHPIVPLAEMINGQEGIFFALLSGKSEAKTKDGKPFFRLLFRDHHREVQSPIWSDNPLYPICKEKWKTGDCFKIAGIFRETDFGPKMEIRRIRPAVESDFADGFSPNLFRPATETAPELLCDEILTLAQNRIGKGPLLALVQRIFKEYRNRILDAPSSRNHHHARFGGMLEHALSVTRIAVSLADHFQTTLPAPQKSTKTEKVGSPKPVAKGSTDAPLLAADGEEKKPSPEQAVGGVRFQLPLVVAGAVLHEIGKIFEMEAGPLTPTHSLSGELVGYPVLGRDLVHRFAPEVGLDETTRLHLEHILLTHPRFPDWGSVGPPRSLEAMVVHLADYADSIFSGAVDLLRSDKTDGPLTLTKGPFGTTLLK